MDNSSLWDSLIHEHSTILATPFYAKPRHPWAHSRWTRPVRTASLKGRTGSAARRTTDADLMLAELVLRRNPGQLLIPHLPDQGRSHHQRGALAATQARIIAGFLGDPLPQEG
jgi:hypothetical protein